MPDRYPEGQATEAERRTVVITGASAGVGRATARAFARRGWRVGLIARGAAGLEGARRDVERLGGAALVLPADVADAAAVERAADRAAAAWGSIEVWINNAMATLFAPFDQTTPDEYRRATEVTYLGQVYGTRAALKHMRRRDCGVILHVGSALAYRGIPLQSAYCGAKFALRGFLGALRVELRHDGSRIRLCAVHLPAVNTPQFEWARNRMPERPRPVPPIFAPEAAAEVIVRAAREAPRELWVGRSTWQAIAANAVAPALVDRLLARRGYADQQAREPERVGRPDNLFRPVAGDFGAAGRFAACAERRVRTVAPARLRGGLALFGLALAAGGLAYALGRRTEEP